MLPKILTKLWKSFLFDFLYSNESVKVKFWFINNFRNSANWLSKVDLFHSTIHLHSHLRKIANHSFETKMIFSYCYRFSSAQHYNFVKFTFLLSSLLHCLFLLKMNRWELAKLFNIQGEQTLNKESVFYLWLLSAILKNVVESVYLSSKVLRSGLNTRSKSVT